MSAHADKLRDGKSFPVGPHSDSGGARNGATLWISLDRADETNGSISYLRGSHRRSAAVENADGVAKSANPFAMLDNFEEGWGEGEIFSMVAEPGDAVIHSSKTLHWSRKSTDNVRRRRAVTYFYGGASEDLKGAQA